MLYTNEQIEANFLHVGSAEYAGLAYAWSVITAQAMRDTYEAALAKQSAEIERLNQIIDQDKRDRRAWGFNSAATVVDGTADRSIGGVNQE